MDLRKWKEPLKNPYPRRIREGRFFYPVTPLQLNLSEWERKKWRTTKFSFEDEMWFKTSMLQTKINAREN